MKKVLYILFGMLFVFILGWSTGDITNRQLQTLINSVLSEIDEIDSAAVDGLLGVQGSLAYNLDAVQEIGASSVFGMALTATLYVSPDGSGSDGKSWTNAYTTIQAALDIASTDANDLTLILIAPHATAYDINTTGDPTWAGNYVLLGSHRHWVEIKNDHASATSILKFTGKASLEHLQFDLGTGTNGIILTHDGAVVSFSHFDGESLTGASTALHLDGATAAHSVITDVDFRGEGKTHMTAILIDNVELSEFYNIIIDAAKTGIQIVNAASDENKFLNIRIGDSGIGFDLDAGNEQHIEDVFFHHNTTDIDDEVGDHVFNNIRSETDVTFFPDNFTGITLSAGSGTDWGTDTEIRSAATATSPFRILGVHVEADANEKFRIRLSDDAGSSHFDDIQIEGVANEQKRESIQAGFGSEHIFNKGTKISGSVKSESGSNNAVVWLEVQVL